MYGGRFLDHVPRIYSAIMIVLDVLDNGMTLDVSRIESRDVIAITSLPRVSTSGDDLPQMAPSILHS